MRSQTKVLLATLAFGPVLVWGPALPDALAHMESFRISDVEVTGLRFLTQDTVVAWMELGAFASVWGDRHAWQERLTAHPMIRRAEVRRRLPNGLRVRIEERQPVALAATPILEPVDVEGHRLPIDPTRYRLDLPVIAAGRMPPPDATVFPSEVRSLAAEFGHLLAADEDFARRVSSVERVADGSVLVSLMSPDVDFVMPARTPVSRLREGEAAFTDAVSRDPGRAPSVVDLRFTDQVVVRRTGKN